MFKEFKEFAIKGNVIDMAVGIVIGGAFGKIVTSLVNDIIMPPVGMLTGGVDFSELYLSLSGQYPTLQKAVDAGAPVIRYGLFIQTLLNFLIISFSIFFVIRQMNRFKKKEEAAPSAPPRQEVLLEEIRDLLKKS